MNSALPQTFIEAKAHREKMCKKNGACSEDNMCWRCQRLRKKMCRWYHGSDSNPRSVYEELHGRLLFEYVFDKISMDDLRNGTWKDPCKRDQGHHLRIAKLCKKAKV